jgi:hypothetical protein
VGSGSSAWTYWFEFARPTGSRSTENRNAISSPAVVADFDDHDHGIDAAVVEVNKCRRAAVENR